MRYSQLDDNLKGAAVLMVAAAAFALMVSMIKLAGQNLHVTQILVIRQFGMLLIMSPKLLPNLRSSFATGRLDLQLLRIGLALIAMTCGFSAVIHMPLADATALGFAKSFFVTIFAVWILRETVGFYRWAAVAIGFVGVLVMLRPASDSFSIYGIYAVVGAAAAGAVMVIIRLLSRTESTHTIMAYQALGVGLFMIIPALIYWQPPSTAEWGILVIVCITSYVGQRCNVVAFTLGEASLLASLDYVRLLYATLLGFLLFKELPQTHTVFGALIIVAAAIFTVYRESKRKQTLSRASDGRGFTNN